MSSLMLFDKQGRPGFEFLVREFRREDGRVTGIKSGVARILLRESSKDWVGFDNVGHITANGYREINRAAGLTIVEPPTVFVEGAGWLPNPHSIIDETTGAWMGGKLRLLAYGRNVTGNMAVSDYTNRMTLHSMVNESLLAVRKRRPSAVIWGFKETSPADLMREVLADWNESIDEEIQTAKRAGWKSKEWKRKLQTSPEDMERIVAKTVRRVKAGIWAFRVVDPMTGQGLWYDVMDSEVGKAFANFSKNDEIGIRKLKGTTYRNVSRDHPATPGMIIPPELIQGHEKDARTATVAVYFHEQIEDKAELDELMKQFAEGVDIANATVVRGEGDISIGDAEPEDGEPEENLGEGMTETEKAAASAAESVEAGEAAAEA